MEFTQRGRKAASTINTKHILFIVSGAFDGLEKIIRKRLREATIGFAAKAAPAGDARGRAGPRARRGTSSSSASSRSSSGACRCAWCAIR